MRRSAIGAVAILMMTFWLPVLPSQAASSFADQAFQAQWQAGEALTPNFWGPLETAKNGQQEPYKEASGGQRVVQYFDKGRMELTNGTVTNGLLATDIVKGQIQVGDATFQPMAPPAIPVAGDPDNPGPTYASLASKAKALFDAAPQQTGNYAQAVLSPLGDISVSNAGPSDPATFTAYDGPTKHNVPNAFADYRTRAGLQTIGYGISEPFTTTVKVGGRPNQVMVQVFERRVLTYTANNPDAFKVEMGNIGLHYYQWRYPTGAPVAPAPPVSPPVTAATLQLAASVSDPAPTQNSRVTVTAKLTNNGAGVAGATMDTTWHYKTTDSSCSGGPSGADGTMSCTRDISRATKGFTVVIDVRVSYQGQTYTASTGFTPR